VLSFIHCICSGNLSTGVALMNDKDRHHRLTPAETPKKHKQEQQDEITRQIAYYLAKGKKITQVPRGQGAGNSEQNF